ncbi:recombinase family protein (plasmid) [Curtobacterium sp. C1]|uniref:recombinase family protein n=1 Tax=Curtobacterium sp. C1 TaxID=2898151 RepID=UPI001E655943|nr:recombinase family protein [Curtobacterium sp. C1]UFU15964.1 recombinase family protein [Curtobacterium sp. C1]
METGWVLGYARVSTAGQDLTAQTDALLALGVPADRVFTDKGMTGTRRDRPGLTSVLAACRSGDTLVVTKLDRLARSLRDATDIAEELTRRQVRLNIGGAIYDPTDPVGHLLFNVLGMVAEFEADLIRARTREGMAVAKARGKLKGRKPKLSPAQERHLVALHRAGDHSIAELVELFGIGRATVYRALDRNPTHVSSDLTLPRAEGSNNAEIASGRG